MSRVFVLDAMALAYRAYYAFIRRPLVNSKGENTSAIFGFANSALKIRREENPDFWVLAWDGPGPTHRHDRYPDYKSTRKPMPEDLLAQIPVIEDMASALGLPVIEVPGAEADDVMATLATRGERDGLDVVLVTSDKDMLQLVSDRVKLLSPVGRGEDYTWVDADAVRAKWGVSPHQIGDVLALMGDSSDNVPGVPGVGEKTAVELIVQFGSLDDLYRRLAEVRKPALREKLGTHRDQAYLSRELIEVRKDCDLPDDWERLRRAPIRREALVELSRRYELGRLERIAEELGVAEAEAGERAPARSPERRGTAAETPAPGVRLAGAPAPETGLGPAGDARPAAPSTTDRRPTSRTPSDARPFAAPPPQASLFSSAPPPAPATGPPDGLAPGVVKGSQESLDLWAGTAAAPRPAAATLERVNEVRARAAHGLVLLPIVAGDDPRRARLVGLGLAARNGAACYLPLAHEAGGNVALEEAREWFAPALGDPDCPKVGMDLKRDLHVLTGAGWALRGLHFDLHVGSFLCDPDREHSLTGLARDVLGVELAPLEVPKGATPAGTRATLASLPAEMVAAWVERAAPLLFPIADALRAQLEAREQFSLYERIEHPLIRVLHDMERTGILIDRRKLEDQSARAAGEIARLEEELFALAGERFNLNSGQQLARVLFEKLKLEPGRRTKTGYSTDSAVLEELARDHPLPARLLEYRHLAKLKSTYLDTLPQVADPRDGRVHTTYQATGAATGRLSSSDPNLQNIPIRTAQGREIRRAFVAPPGRLLVGGDYSQIELRIMAHLSGDPNLIEAFASGEDVHASTARRVFGVSGEALDPALRARAKIVNFGVMYGMGARSLSAQMEIPLKDAQEFIADYFRVYARVKEFLTQTVEEARHRGYVQTVLGRRRYLAGLASAHGGDRSFAERAAINTPIQGSAADVMKLAMIHVHRALKHAFPSARLLLQVHDELLIECDAAEADGVAELTRLQMASCFEMRVPLEVSMGRGPSWFDVH